MVYDIAIPTLPRSFCSRVSTLGHVERLLQSLATDELDDHTRYWNSSTIADAKNIKPHIIAVASGFIKHGNETYSIYSWFSYWNSYFQWISELATFETRGRHMFQNHKPRLSWIGAEESFGALSNSASQYGCVGQQSGTLRDREHIEPRDKGIWRIFHSDLFPKEMDESTCWWYFIRSHEYQCIVVDSALINPTWKCWWRYGHNVEDQSNHLCASKAMKTPGASDTPWAFVWFSG